MNWLTTVISGCVHAPSRCMCTEECFTGQALPLVYCKHPHACKKCPWKIMQNGEGPTGEPIWHTHLSNSGAWGSVKLQVGRTQDRFQAVTLGIYSVAADISMCPGVDSASKKWVPGYSWGKGGRCVRVTTLPPSCAECLVIWSLNQPEPSGPHRPVIGIALPFLPLRIKFLVVNCCCGFLN